MPRPFQWSTDDDDEVYKVHKIQHCSGEEGVERPKTFYLHCTKVEY